MNQIVIAQQKIVEAARLLAAASETALAHEAGILARQIGSRTERTHAPLPVNAAGSAAALNDAIVKRALHFVHSDPTRRWTVDDLARKAGSSRSVLSERFNDVLGQAPIAYITKWRMQLAAERIRNSTDSFAAIAADVGYGSLPAFNRAFKRIMGVPPGQWRDRETSRVDRRSLPPSAGVGGERGNQVLGIVLV
jgi:AraC-like DNA-binding protein